MSRFLRWLRALKRPQRNLTDKDYTLIEGAAWFTVKGFAIHIHAADEGVVVDIFDNELLKTGDIDSVVASTWARDDELVKEPA